LQNKTGARSTSRDQIPNRRVAPPNVNFRLISQGQGSRSRDGQPARSHYA
jgi:hypothetical protein